MAFELEFKEGEQLDFVVETEGDLFWLVAMIRVSDRELFLNDLLFYPATATRARAGYTSIRSIFRMLEKAAREQGFVSCVVNASRSKPDGRRRILSFRRVLA